MTLQQMREKRNRVALEAYNTLPTTGAASPEQLNKFDNLIAEAERLALDIEREEQRSSRPPRSAPGAGAVTDSPERRSFSDYIRYGIVSDSLRRETRDLSTGTGAAGGYLIAQDFSPVLVEAQKAYGALAYAVGQKITRNGEPLRVSGIDDTANMSTTIGESTTGNPVVVSEVDPSFAGLISNVDFMSTGEIKISLAELQDSFFDLDSWIRNAFGKRIARGLANKIVNPGASSNFTSIITAAPLTYQSTATPSGAPTYNDFVGMYAALDPAYIQTASWVMNSSTRAAILGEKDTLGRPLFVPNVNTDNLGTILGLPVVISQYHPNVGANSVGAVQLASLKDHYVLRTAGEVSILRLNERYADQGQIAFIGYHRNGGWAQPVGKAAVNLVQAGA